LHILAGAVRGPLFVAVVYGEAQFRVGHNDGRVEHPQEAVEQVVVFPRPSRVYVFLVSSYLEESFPLHGDLAEASGGAVSVGGIGRDDDVGLEGSVYEFDVAVYDVVVCVEVDDDVARRVFAGDVLGVGVYEVGGLFRADVPHKSFLHGSGDVFTAPFAHPVPAVVVE